MRVVFMGTPDFAAASLEKLAAAHEVLLVVTRPDTKQGRKQQLTPPEVKVMAEALQIPVIQPMKVTDAGFVEELQKTKADIFVVAAFGEILPIEILNMPTHGSLNIHASLLPRWRGAGPIHRAIIAGDTETGISIMQMDAGLDTGDVLLSKKINILPTDTAGSLHDKLAILGGEAIIEALDTLDKLIPLKQDNSLATYAHKIERSTGDICFGNSAREIDFLVRGVNPWPGAFIYGPDEGDRYKVWAGTVTPMKHNKTPGEIIDSGKAGVLVACQTDAYLITEMQRIGGKRMDMQAFLCGCDMNPGSCFRDIKENKVSTD